MSKRKRFWLSAGQFGYTTFSTSAVEATLVGVPFDRDKMRLVIDSAVERGLTSKPPDADKLVDFSFAKELGY